jgi:hypothetical protein
LHVVYLDQAKWIDLARAHHGRSGGARFRDALAASQAAVADHRAVFPLSSTHYMETSVRQDDASRARLVEVMEALSWFTAMGSQVDVVPVEIDRALRSRFGRPEQPRQLTLYGYGAAHAFGEPSLAYEAPPDQPPVIRAQMEAVGRPHLERELLRHGMKDPAALAQHRKVDLEFAQAQDDFSERLRQAGYGRGPRLQTAMVGAIMMEIVEPLQEAVERAGVDEELILEMLSDRDASEAFIRDMPSRWAMLELQRARHAGGAPFEEGDLRDLGALAVAFAYCDVVVTEKQWVHIARQAKLDEIFGTIVTADASDLATILAV